MQRELAEAYYKNNQFGRAVDAYTQCSWLILIILIPDQPLVMLRCCSLTKILDESLALVNRLLKRDPNNFVLKRLAMIIIMKLKQYDKALESCKDVYADIG